MNRRLMLTFVLIAGLSIPHAANAWFFIWIPTGKIQQALETDPDSIQVSQSDRALGKCAGFHLNQAQKGMDISSSFPRDRSPGAPEPQSPAPSPESKFHSDMADLALQRSNDKEKMKSLGEAYSVRWSRVAAADRQANRQYGTDLARSCIANDIPARYSDLPTWQSRQDEKKRLQAEEERKRIQAEEEKRRIDADERRARTEEQTKSALKSVDPSPSDGRASTGVTQVPGIDFITEAKKSARILGCTTDDVRVTGAEQNNILISASCGNNQQLLLTCDKSGLCLRR